MPAAIVTAAVGLYSAHQQRKGAKEGAKAQAAASNAAIGEQQRQYDQTRNDLSPFMQFGQQAIPLLSQLSGGDYSGFLNSPDYLAARDLGQSQIDHGAAARGGLFGGGNTRDTMKFGSQLGAQYLNQYRDSLFQQAGMGQNAAAGLGGLGANMAGQIGAQYKNIGNARQSAYQQGADTNSQLAGGLAGMFNGMYQQNQARNPGGTPWYFGSRPGAG